MRMRYEDREADPRVVRAMQLLDTSGIPTGAGHARENIRYMVKMAALDPEQCDFGPTNHDQIITNMVRTYWRRHPDMWPGLVERFERLVRSAREAS